MIRIRLCWALLDPDPLLFVRIRILPSTSKQITCCLVTSWWLFIFEVWCEGTYRKYLNKQQKKLGKNFFLLAFWKSLTKRAGSGFVNQVYRSKDPDPNQDVTDLEHCWIPSLNAGDGTLGSKAQHWDVVFHQGLKNVELRIPMWAYFTVYMECILHIGLLSLFKIDTVYYR